MEGGGWRMEDGGWRMEDGGWRVEGGGWRMEDGGRRKLARTRKMAFTEPILVVIMERLHQGTQGRGEKSALWDIHGQQRCRM